MNAIMIRIALLLVGLLAAHYLPFAGAQTFPSKPIRIIVPWAPGGLVDASARVLGGPVGDAIGQPLVVENRAGANSMIGMQTCAESASDGYTLCMTTADSLLYNPHVYKNLPYDPENGFIPVINLFRSNSGSALVANARAPFNSIKELIAFAKSKPRAVNWGTWGPGTAPDVYVRWITHKTGAEITAVPYKGAGQTLPALLAGDIDSTFGPIGSSAPHIKAGKLKPIAVIGTRRSPLFPEVPTLTEQDVDPGLRSYIGLYAPAATPGSIVNRLNAEFAKGLQAPRVRDFLGTFMLDADGGSAADFAEFLKGDRANAALVFKTIGIRPSDAPP